jgi:hypothetical protein
VKIICSILKAIAEVSKDYGSIVASADRGAVKTLKRIKCRENYKNFKYKFKYVF